MVSFILITFLPSQVHDAFIINLLGLSFFGDTLNNTSSSVLLILCNLACSFNQSLTIR